MKHLQSIILTFESTETVKLSPDDIIYLKVEEISPNVYYTKNPEETIRNDYYREINLAKKIVFILDESANEKYSDSIYSKHTFPLFERIKQWNDITAITLVSDEDEVTYSTLWMSKDVNGEINAYQRNIERPQNRLLVAICKEFIEEEELADIWY